MADTDSFTPNRHCIKWDASESSAVDVIPPAQTVKMAVIVIATVPMLIVYPLFRNILSKEHS